MIDPEDWSNLGYTNKTFPTTAVIMSNPTTPPAARKSTCIDIYKRVRKSINTNRMKADKLEKEQVVAAAAVPVAAVPVTAVPVVCTG